MLVPNSFCPLLAALPNLNFDRICAYYNFSGLFLKSYKVFIKELVTGLTCRRAQCIYFAIANYEPHLSPWSSIMNLFILWGPLLVSALSLQHGSGLIALELKHVESVSYDHFDVARHWKLSRGKDHSTIAPTYIWLVSHIDCELSITGSLILPALELDSYKWKQQATIKSYILAEQIIIEIAKNPQALLHTDFA